MILLSIIASKSTSQKLDIDRSLRRDDEKRPSDLNVVDKTFFIFLLVITIELFIRETNSN